MHFRSWCYQAFVLGIASKASSAPPSPAYLLPWSDDHGLNLNNHTGKEDTFLDRSTICLAYSAIGENTEQWNIENSNPPLQMDIDSHRSDGIAQTAVESTLEGALNLAQQISQRLPEKEQARMEKEFVFRLSDSAEAHFKICPTLGGQLLTWNDILEVLGKEGLPRYYYILRRFSAAGFLLESKEPEGARGQIAIGSLEQGPGDQPSTPIPTELSTQPSLSVETS